MTSCVLVIVNPPKINWWTFPRASYLKGNLQIALKIPKRGFPEVGFPTLFDIKIHSSPCNQHFIGIFNPKSFDTVEWGDGKGHLASLLLHLHNHSKEERKKERGEQQRRRRQWRRAARWTAAATVATACWIPPPPLPPPLRAALLACARYVVASALAQRAATCPRGRGLQRHQILTFL